MSLPPIVMFPAVQWADLHQRPHHFARLFAARGHRVVWVEGRDLGVQAPDPIWRTLEDHGMWRRLAAVQETHDGVKIVRPVVEVANDHGVRAGSRRNWLRGLMETNYHTGGITWIGYVAWIDAVLSFSGSGRIVYDCCDDLSALSSHLVLQEAEAAACADVVLCTHPALVERMSSLRPRAPVLVPNAADADLFRPPADWTPPLAKNGGPVLGYAGSLALLDVDLIDRLSQRHPDWRWDIAGDYPGPGYDRLREIPTVRLRGHVPHGDLPGIMRGWSVAVIPWRDHPCLPTVDPCKAYEYVAAGLPVVSVPMVALDRWAGFVHTALSVEGWEESVALALAERSRKWVDLRLGAAQGETWAARVETAWSAVEEAMGR